MGFTPKSHHCTLHTAQLHHTASHCITLQDHAAGDVLPPTVAVVSSKSDPATGTRTVVMRRKMKLTGPVIDLIKFPLKSSRLSSRTTADLHQPPFRATAAVCRRLLGRRTDLNGRKLTLFV